MKVKIKKLVPEAVIPFYATQGDAGMDLTATWMDTDEYGNVVYGFGLAFEIPEGYMGLVFPRSSNAKKALTLTNSIGVIDSGYRGEVTVKFKPTQYFRSEVFDNMPMKKMYQVGERVAQIIIVPFPTIEFEEADELSETERGAGGYGHTGE